MLKDELKRMKEVERPKNVRDIEEARAHGDLSENAEYAAAKEKQSFIEGRIRELEAKLAMAQVIDTSKLNGKKVVFGAIVTLQDPENDEEVTYRIVGEDEADIKQGKIAVTAPLARALIGHEVEETVKVRTPGGMREYEIVGLRFE
jgi:transcription elongation factor GreA